MFFLLCHAPSLLGVLFAYLTSFSSISFASLTLVAKYGEPPRSGWLSSMRDRCFLRRSSFVTPRSLSEVSVGSTSFRNAWSNVRHLEDQGSFSPCHLGLKATLVEASSKLGTANAVLAYRDERSTTLSMLAGPAGDWWGDVRRRHLRPDQGPIARETWWCVYFVIGRKIKCPGMRRRAGDCGDGCCE